MAFELVTVPCLSDNYAFLLHNDETEETVLADAPEAAPILKALDERDWQLSEILLTHHHGDHIDGVAAVREEHFCRVIGAAADRERLPPLDIEVEPGSLIRVCGTDAEVIDVSGHTVGHIAYNLPEAEIAFTGDSLMALGCGRLFEGKPEQMWQSLLRLRGLPERTKICSGHEYTAANAAFALTVDPSNAALVARAAAVKQARANDQPTVPSSLSEEIATNPFLRADVDGMGANVDLPDATPAEIFAEIRKRKDNF